MINRGEEEDQTLPLARWTDSLQPAGLSTKTGGDRFVVTVKLAEKSLKSASNFVKEANEALKTHGSDVDAEFVLVDGERTRLQRATASFATFKEAKTCLTLLAELGLRIGQISAELEDFGTNQYDPWFERRSKAWWPWLASLRDPAPQMPMMKVTNRLDLTEGSKYKQGASGKLGKSDEVDRNDARVEQPPEDAGDRDTQEPREEEGSLERKKRKKKKSSGE